MLIGIIVLSCILVLLLIRLWQESKQRNFLNLKAEEAQKELNLVKEANAEYRARLEIIEEYRQNIRELKQENEEIKDYNADLQKQLATVETKEKALIDKEKTLREEFDNIARKILEDNTKKLSEASSLKLQDVLNPFREKLNEFHKKVDDVYVKEEKERYSLKEEIKKLVETHENLYSQAENLTKALKGDNKLQGNWGEVQLVNILEQSGLDSATDYTLQGKGYGLEFDGKRQQPDVIVNLPEGKHIVIDSKVNLVAYEKYINTDQQEEKKEYSKQFLNSVREQIKNLSSKAYHSNDKLSSPDFTMMFMPIESAYTLAISEDPTLYSFAWERNIILVSSSVLFAMLKTISYIISNDKKNKNVEEILKRSADMYDKFANFVEDMEKIGVSLGRSQDSYNEAIKKLKDGQGSLISKAENIKKLGLTTKKSISRLKDTQEIYSTNDVDEELNIS